MVDDAVVDRRRRGETGARCDQLPGRVDAYEQRGTSEAVHPRVDRHEDRSVRGGGRVREETLQRVGRPRRDVDGRNRVVQVGAAVELDTRQTVSHAQRGPESQRRPRPRDRQRRGGVARGIPRSRRRSRLRQGIVSGRVVDHDLFGSQRPQRASLPARLRVDRGQAHLRERRHRLGPLHRPRLHVAREPGVRDAVDDLLDPDAAVDHDRRRGGDQCRPRREPAVGVVQGQVSSPAVTADCQSSRPRFSW
jgi:hypothetical protein